MVINIKLSGLQQIVQMKNISGKSIIFYAFQTKSKQIEYNMTTFKKSAPQEPKIRDVLYELPLDFQNNSYHFRFRSQFFQADQKIIGWIDISNLLAKVPIINGNIYVKILTIPSDKENKLFNKQKLKAIGLLDPKGLSPAKKTSKSPDLHPRTSSNGPTVTTATPVSNPTKVQQKSKQNLFDVDMSPQLAKVKSESKKQVIVPTQTVKPFVPGGETPQQRLKGFKEQMKIQEEERQLQQKAIKFHEDKLNQWGYSGHKTINNLTTLLATLHQIWPQWPPVSLSDMLRPEDVTAIYKKAVVRLHPDKNHNKDYETKYLAKRIFELLNQAKKAQK